MFTPGVEFLLRTAIPVVLGPPVVIHALLMLSSRFWKTLAPTPLLLACIYTLSLPAHLVIWNHFTHLKHALAARRLGARVTPSPEGALPGNVDILYQNMSAGKDQYIMEPWINHLKRLGTTFTITILKTQIFCTINPKNVQKVLVTDFQHYRKGGIVGDILKSMLGNGVFTSDGEMWQFHRKMIRPFLSKERVTDLQLFERKAATALQKMQDRLDAGYAVDFQDLVARFTLDSAAEFLLGASINSIDSPLPLPHNVSSSHQQKTDQTASNRFAQAFAAAQITILNRIEMSNLWPLAEFFEDKLKNPMAEIRSFIDPIVRNAISQREKGDGKENQTLLGHLLEVTDDMQTIVDQTLNLMLAGRDTTASLLTFVTYCLATHPAVLSRLREEIINTIGTARPPSYDDLRNMKYLRCVLNETLRLFPPVPFSARETVNETTWVDDEGQKLYIPPNARLGLSFMLLHRSETYWGPDAHIFDPDRWTDSRLQLYTSNPFIFVPFNAGPRICVGQQFAYNETSFFLVRMLQRFETLELALECQPPHTRPPASWADPTTAPLLGMRRPLERCFPREHLTLYADVGFTEDYGFVRFGRTTRRSIPFRGWEKQWFLNARFSDDFVPSDF